MAVGRKVVLSAMRKYILFLAPLAMAVLVVASSASAAPGIQTELIHSQPAWAAPLAPYFSVGIEVKNAGGIGEGTGVIVSQQGGGEWIATAYHVIHGATSVEVYSPAGGPFGSAHPVTRAVYDAAEDLALVYVPRFLGGDVAQIAPMPAADASGEAQCVNGPAWTLQRQPLVLGSSYETTAPGFPYILQSAAPVIMVGCSGGPILDYQNQLVGITLQVIYGSETGIGYAPATEIDALLQETAP